jgi:hypothetical protein
MGVVAYREGGNVNGVLRSRKGGVLSLFDDPESPRWYAGEASSVWRRGVGCSAWALWDGPAADWLDRDLLWLAAVRAAYLSALYTPLVVYPIDEKLGWLACLSPAYGSRWTPCAEEGRTGYDLVGGEGSHG